jgi:hypothetical protein
VRKEKWRLWLWLWWWRRGAIPHLRTRRPTGRCGCVSGGTHRFVQQGAHTALPARGGCGRVRHWDRGRLRHDWSRCEAGSAGSSALVTEFMRVQGQQGAGRRWSETSTRPPVQQLAQPWAPPPAAACTRARTGASSGGGGQSLHLDPYTHGDAPRNSAGCTRGSPNWWWVATLEPGVVPVSP